MARTIAKSGTRTWRRNRDPLYRGDGAKGPSLPDPEADKSIVRHVLFLGGAGRPTPYHSTSEIQAIAAQFAGSKGRVYECKIPDAEVEGIRHISRTELLRLLKGRGQGAARRGSTLEVMQARRYVEEWMEHLLDFSDLQPGSDLHLVVDRVYRSAKK